MRKLSALFIVCLGFGAWWYFGGQGWLAIHSGTDYCPSGLSPIALTTCKAYGFLSGAGSDLGEIALITGIWGNAILLWRKNTCHYTWWCWRHPHHQVADTNYFVCTHHSPKNHPTVKEAVAAEKERLANG